MLWKTYHPVIFQNKLLDTNDQFLMFFNSISASSFSYTYKYLTTWKLSRNNAKHSPNFPHLNTFQHRKKVNDGLAISDVFIFPPLTSPPPIATRAHPALNLFRNCPPTYQVWPNIT